MLGTPPYFSLVIPTRNRAKYLRYALQSVLRSSSTDFEVLVSDNSDEQESNAVRDVVAMASDERVRYVRPSNGPLSMSAHWHFALQHIRGHKTLLVGDDDALMPSSLAAIRQLFISTEAKVIRWPFATYFWDDFVRVPSQNVLVVPLSRSETCLRGRYIRSADRLSDRRLWRHHDLLPMLYNSAVDSALVHTLFAGPGSGLLSEAPDIYSGFCIAYACETFWESSIPLSVNGVSGASNGASALADDPSHPIVQDFQRLNCAGNISWHPSVPRVRSIPATVAESLQHFLDTHPSCPRYCLEPTSRDWVRLAINAILQGIANHESKHRQLSVLVKWLEANAPELVELAAESIETLPDDTTDRSELDNHRVRCGVYSHGVTLDGRVLGLSNVSDAAAVAEAVLALDQKIEHPVSTSESYRVEFRDFCPPVLGALWRRMKNRSAV